MSEWEIHTTGQRLWRLRERRRDGVTGDLQVDVLGHWTVWRVGAGDLPIASGTAPDVETGKLIARTVWALSGGA